MHLRHTSGQSSSWIAHFSIKMKCLIPSLFVSLCLSPCGRPAPKTLSEQGSSSEKKERPMSTMSEASNYTGGSDYSTFPGSPATTVTTATTTSTSSTRVSLYLNLPHNSETVAMTSVFSEKTALGSLRWGSIAKKLGHTLISPRG